MGDSTGVLVILVIGVTVSFFLYQLCSCFMDGRCSSCSRQQRPNYDNQGLNSALITLALPVGQQQNVSQQQQHQPTGVTPGYSYSTVNQSLLPTAPDPQSTRPPGYSYSTVNQALLPTAPALQSTKPSYL